MPYVQRTNGVVTGLYANPQPGYAEEWLADDHADVVAFRAPPVPAEAERQQCLLALFGDGTTPGITEAMILAAINEIADPVERERSRLTFYRSRWRRDSPFIAWGQATFGLTDAQVDDLFRLAVTL